MRPLRFIRRARAGRAEVSLVPPCALARPALYKQAGGREPTRTHDHPYCHQRNRPVTAWVPIEGSRRWPRGVGYLPVTHLPGLRNSSTLLGSRRTPHQPGRGIAPEFVESRGQRRVSPTASPSPGEPNTRPRSRGHRSSTSADGACAATPSRTVAVDAAASVCERSRAT